MTWEEAASKAERDYDGEESEEEAEKEEKEEKTGIAAKFDKWWDAIFGGDDDEEDEELAPEDQVR